MTAHDDIEDIADEERVAEAHLQLQASLTRLGQSAQQQASRVGLDVEEVIAGLTTQLELRVADAGRRALHEHAVSLLALTLVLGAGAGVAVGRRAGLAPAVHVLALPLSRPTERRPMKTNMISQLSSTSALLDLFGLQAKPSTGRQMLTWAGLITAGVVVGAGAALLLTPKTGRQLRGDIKDGAKELGEQVASTASSALGSARRVAGGLRDGRGHSDGAGETTSAVNNT